MGIRIDLSPNVFELLSLKVGLVNAAVLEAYARVLGLREEILAGRNFGGRAKGPGFEVGSSGQPVIWIVFSKKVQVSNQVLRL